MKWILKTKYVINSSRKYGSVSFLYESILSALEKSGVEASSKNPNLHDTLKAVDEFHIGGRAATTHLLKQVDLCPGMKLLDIGSGLGGTARFIVTEYPGVQVKGIDLTPEFVEVASKLTHLTGFDGVAGSDINFAVGSALAIGGEDASYDRATMLHVGMNIEDKELLFREVARVLKSGGIFAIYDAMLANGTTNAQLPTPLPWADSEEGSHVSTSEDYSRAAEAAGFTLEAATDRSEFAKAFFAPILKKLSARDGEKGLPPLSMLITFGRDAITKMHNVIHVVNSDAVAPKEMIFRKR